MTQNLDLDSEALSKLAVRREQAALEHWCRMRETTPKQAMLGMLGLSVCNNEIHEQAYHRPAIACLNHICDCLIESLARRFRSAWPTLPFAPLSQLTAFLATSSLCPTSTFDTFVDECNAFVASIGLSDLPISWLQTERKVSLSAPTPALARRNGTL